MIKLKRSFDLFYLIIFFSLLLFFYQITTSYSLPFNAYDLDLTFFLIVLTFCIQILRKNSSIHELGLSNIKFDLNNLKTIGLFTIFFFIINFVISYFLQNKSVIESYQNSPSSLVFVFSILVISINEELIFRGIIFQILEDTIGDKWTLVITSLIFTAAHTLNNNFNVIAGFNILLAGFILGVILLKSRSFYALVLFHFLWNYLSAIILNSPISGYNYYMGIVNFSYSTNSFFENILWGGPFGIESGILSTIGLSLMSITFGKKLIANPYIESLKLKKYYSWK